VSHVARVERTVAASPVRVWQAVATAELAAWYWPARFATEAMVDAWPGGRFRFASAPVGMGARGRVTAADAPALLALTWRWDGEDLETTVTIRLEADGDGTRIRVEHAGFPTAEAADEHAQGWADCLDRLPGHLAASERSSG
jgi:uncharacterized protein YndB with AHSA1/START domain